MKPQINTLFVKKLIVAFVVGFCGALITTVTGLSTSPDFKFDKAALISLVAGALAAGVRAVIALSPVNLVPSDAQHSVVNITDTKAETGQVGVVVAIAILIILIAICGGVFVNNWLWIILLALVLLIFFR